MSPRLQDLFKSAKRDGWTIASNVPIASVRYLARLLDWTPVTSRKSDPAVSELRPTEAENAHPRSLSALYGTGPQPLHTDGAHLADPPDLTILFAESPNDTPTLLWNSQGRQSNVPYEAISHGVFLVGNGRESFYATAKLGPLTIRYDPGCMTPCDQRARTAAAYFSEMREKAHQVTWETSNQLLMIDNSTTLHARSDASSDESRILHRLMYRTKGGT